MKAGKALKVAGSIAASVALLVMLAGCGQASKPSPKSETSSNTPAKSTYQGASSTQASSAASPSPSTSSSSTSTLASPPPSSSNASSTPAASSSPASTGASTQQMPSNEVLYLLAYIKYRGGLEAITPSDLIVDEYMIGTQKGTVLPDVPQSEKMIPSSPMALQMKMNGNDIEVLLPHVGTDVADVYNANDLVNEYYSTFSQQEQVNSLLQEGERHNVLDVLALMNSSAWDGNAISNQEGELYIRNNELEDGGADMSAYALIKGSTIEICVMSSAGANPPMYYQYYYFNAQSLLDKYYSTPSQKAQVNEYISFGTRNGSYTY